MNVRTLFLCLTAAAALQSCWLPPFDPELSASQYTIGLLGDPVWSARIRLENQGEGGWYLPPKDPSQYGQGVWVREESERIFLWALRTFEWDYTQLDHLYDSPNTLGRARLLSMPAGFNGNYYVFVAAQGEGMRKVGGSGFNALWDMGGFALTAVGSAPAGPGADRYFMARWDTAVNDLIISHSLMDSISAMPPPAPANDTLFNTPPRYSAAAFFSVSPANAWYYLSGPTSAGIESYIWKAATDMPVRLPIDRQLTGVLSDGRLLADGGDELYVYGPEGASLFSIRTGPLRFVHERYHIDPLEPANNRWLSVFTRTVRIPKDKDDSSEYLIEVFEMPTESLKKLAK